MKGEEVRILKRVFLNPLELLVKNWPTPLLLLNSLSKDGYRVWAKLEFYNPFSHSVKDRPVWNMLRRAMEKGKVSDRLYEASSGNVAIALASLAAIHGLKFRAYLPAPTPSTTKTLIRVLGAEYVSTDYPTIGPEMIEYVAKLAEKDGATNLNQFHNDANYEAHYEYTGREIVEQLEAVGEKPSVLVAGIGTSGHIAAITRRLRERFGDDVKVVGVQPAPGSSIPGIKRLETQPKWINWIRVDEVVDVPREEAIDEAINVARSEGLLVGLSSGAVVRAFKKIREKYGPGTYVLVFPDDGFKYVEAFANRLRG